MNSHYFVFESLTDRNRYWNDSYFKALEKIGPVANEHNLSLAEVSHHLV